MMVLAQWTRSPDCRSSSSGFGVTVVDYQDIQKFSVRLSHTGDGNGQALGRHQNIRGSRHRLVANDGADGGDRGVVCFSASMMPGTARMGPMLVMGLLGASSTTVADRMASVTPGAGSALFGSGEANGIDRILIPALHEIFFEAQFADRRVDPGFHAGVAHGKDPGLHAHLGSDGSGNFSQSFAFLATILCAAGGPRDRGRRRETRWALPVHPWPEGKKRYRPLLPSRAPC